MKNQNAGRSRLFFIEFLIVLFFFLIVSTVCLRLFVKAHRITQDANALAHAQSAAASVAEALSAGEGTQEEVAGYFPDAIADHMAAENDSGDASVDPGLADGDSTVEDAYTLTLLYDRQFVSCDSQEQAYYTLTAAVTLRGNEKSADISVCDAGQKELYSLSVSFHTPLTREEAMS